MKKNPINRREFFKKSTVAGAGLSVLPFAVSGSEQRETRPTGAEGADWLVHPPEQKAQVTRNRAGQLVLQNGIVSRTFTTEKNGACVALDHLITRESFLRSVRPEAEVVLNGMRFEVGGLKGQPIHNYLLPSWLEQMHSDAAAFQLAGYDQEPVKARFPWKQRSEWLPKETPWPPPGRMLTFHYELTDAAVQALASEATSDASRPVLAEDDFMQLDPAWQIHVSDTDERNSFINEGKPGEIMALANTAVFADQTVAPQARVFVVDIDPGTDQSRSWGPGMGLVFEDRVVKVNLRPGDNRFEVFDGSAEHLATGMQAGSPVELRMELTDTEIRIAYRYAGEFTEIERVAYDGQPPKAVRVGKMDRQGGSGDHASHGDQGRLQIRSFQMLGSLDEAAQAETLRRLEYLRQVRVHVHHELYDGMPVFCKWISVENRSDEPVTLDRFTSEILAATEPESQVELPPEWLKPNITVESDYSFGGMHATASTQTSVFWGPDPLYTSQVNYQRQTPVLLECRPQYGPATTIPPGQTLESFRVWELVHDSWDRERKGLERRRMYRSIAPWATENPILMHVRQSDNESVKIAIDQCAEVGFEMVILTFGSGFSMENNAPENLSRMKHLADYAHSKGIAIGGYSLLASRRVGGGNDVELPEGMRPTFGNSPCLDSEWGIDYFNKLYEFFNTTGMDILEHDGSYPGDPCAAEHHPAHKGFDDSQWSQFERIRTFYRWCRENAIYLNVPDWYFLNGSNKTGMGYREVNWSLPRAQQEIIERQNIYDGTWEKTPSMGWMFVPLVEYHGGGPAATIEPLREHLPHYEQRLANLFGAGVQACYRGPRLYDAPETKALVMKWVDFYKKYRRILDSDIIHVRRADGRDFDAILHVDPSGPVKGLLMVYNPLNTSIRRTLPLNVYYSGVHEVARVAEQDGEPMHMQVDRNYEISLDVQVPARSQNWYVIR